MFSLLSLNFFLAGAVAAGAIPLALHMIQSSQTVKMPFSTIRFLKIAEKKSSRQMRMENFILWLLRTLLLLFLATAFGVPVVRMSQFGNFLMRTQRNVAIVIDKSYSMEYKLDKGSVWEQALESATEIVNGLNEGDKVVLYLADEDVVPVIEQLSSELDFAKEQIKAQKCGFSVSKLAPAIMAANDALMEDTSNREREIHIITDNQAIPWRSFGKGDITSGGVSDEEESSKKPASGDDEEGEEEEEEDNPRRSNERDDKEETASISGWEPRKVAEKTAVFVTLLGVNEPENVTPADVDVAPRLIMEDMASKLSVTLSHVGSAREVSVTVFLDGQELQSRSTIVGGGGDGGELTFSLPPLAAGDHTAKIELPDDNLLIDNDFNFLFKVKEALPTLVVGRKNEIAFLRQAMLVGLGGKSGIRADVVDPSALDPSVLREYSCVFVCNVLPLDGSVVRDLEQYVRGGGLLVFFPGDRGIASDYNSWECLPADVESIKDVPLSKRKFMLRWEMPQHKLLRELKIGAGGAPILTIRNHLGFGKLNKDSKVLVSAGAENPFILDREFGLGHVLVYSVACDRTWSSLPLSPYFLPFVRQTVQYGAGLGGFVPYVWAADSLSLREFLPEAGRDTAILDPEGQEISVGSSVIEGKTVFFAENMTKPGVYSMRRPGDSAEVPALAVNLPRDESDLTTVDQMRINEIMELDDVYLSNSKDQMLKTIEDHRMGKSLAETCLWLTLIIAAIEFFYANMKCRKPRKLSEDLAIDVTGEVKG
jgi:hypothetical protein